MADGGRRKCAGSRLSRPWLLLVDEDEEEGERVSIEMMFQKRTGGSTEGGGWR
jgi:hypothetical protein